MYLVRHTLPIFPVIAYPYILEHEREGSRRRNLALRVRALQSPSAFLFKWAIPRKREGQGSVKIVLFVAVVHRTRLSVMPCI
jgi:hypothetical protein